MCFFGYGAKYDAKAKPMQALVFVVLFLVLQQVEGNLIYPHVVGEMVLDTTLPTPVVRKSHRFFASSAQLMDRFSRRLVISG